MVITISLLLALVLKVLFFIEVMEIFASFIFLAMLFISFSEFDVDLVRNYCVQGHEK